MLCTGPTCASRAVCEGGSAAVLSPVVCEGGGQQPPRRLSFAWNHILPSKAAGEGSAATGMAAADLAMENGGRRQWGACLGLAAQRAGFGALELVLRRWPA